MDVTTGAWFALIGFVGTAAGMAGVTKSQPRTTLRVFSSLLLMFSCFSCLVMAEQGLHLWMQGWNPGPIDTEAAGRVAGRARGKGGIFLLVGYFFPQFLVFGYGTLFGFGAFTIFAGLDQLPNSDTDT